MIQCYNVIKNESGVFILQIITFLFVVLPLLFIISLFQRKKKRPIVRKDYGITLVLGIIGVFLASIILTSYLSYYRYYLLFLYFNVRKSDQLLEKTMVSRWC